MSELQHLADLIRNRNEIETRITGINKMSGPDGGTRWVQSIEGIQYRPGSTRSGGMGTGASRRTAWSFRVIR